MKLTVALLIALCLVVSYASEARIDEDFDSLDASADEFIQVKAEVKAQAKTSASLFDSARHGVMATEKDQMLQMQHLHVTVDRIMKSNPELAAQIGVVNYSQLRGPDGYGDMEDIMEAIDELAKKIQAEASEALVTVTAIRNQCIKDRNRLRNSIINYTDLINTNNTAIKTNQAGIISDKNDIVASEKKQAKQAAVKTAAQDDKVKVSDGYWDRRNHRDRERRVLKLALFLTCDFRAFSADPYCVWLKSNMNADVPKGCDVVITGSCKNNSLQPLKFTDDVGAYTVHSDISQDACIGRAQYYYDQCGNDVTTAVTVTFRANPNWPYTYPTQDLASYYRIRNATNEKEEADYNLKMQTTIAEDAVELKKKLDGQKAEDLDRQKKLAAAGLTPLPTLAALPTVAPKLDYFHEFVDENLDQELVEETSWTQDKIDAKRVRNVERMKKVLSMGGANMYSRLLHQAKTFMKNGSLDTLDSEASEDVKAARKTLVELLKNLRQRLKDEQEKEDADYALVMSEDDAIIKSAQTQINNELALQDKLKKAILQKKADIATSTDIVTSSTKSLADTTTQYNQVNKDCKEAEDTYIVSKFSTDAEMVNVDKLRSVLRVLATSDLPKCPNDCTRPDQGYCQWKGRFGADSQCACEPEFYGIDCGRKRCPGSGSNAVKDYAANGYGSLYEASDIAACTNSNRGTCDDDSKSTTAGKCICKPGYYHGPKQACEYKICPGVPASFDSKVDPEQSTACNKNGVCNINTGVCTCTATSIYYGAACNLKKCWNYSANIYMTKENPSSCNQHGSCDDTTGKCVCYSDSTNRYYGDYCQLRRCPGNGVCNGSGSSCNTSTGQCSCASGLYGSNCQYKVCPDGCNTGAGNSCDANYGTCTCVAPSASGNKNYRAYSGYNCNVANRDNQQTARDYGGSSFSLPDNTYRSYWWDSMDGAASGNNTSSCAAQGRANTLIAGLYFNSGRQLWNLEGAYCVRPMLGTSALTLGTCYDRDWTSTWGRGGSAMTVSCLQDEFLAGFQRTKRTIPKSDYMTMIKYGYCCKINNATAVGCYNDDWGKNQLGKWNGGSTHHFFVGVIRSGDSEGIDSWTGARVCTFKYTAKDK